MIFQKCFYCARLYRKNLVNIKILSDFFSTKRSDYFRKAFIFYMYFSCARLHLRNLMNIKILLDFFLQETRLLQKNTYDLLKVLFLFKIAQKKSCKYQNVVIIFFLQKNGLFLKCIYDILHVSFKITYGKSCEYQNVIGFFLLKTRLLQKRNDLLKRNTFSFWPTFIVL